MDTATNSKKIFIGFPFLKIIEHCLIKYAIIKTEICQKKLRMRIYGTQRYALKGRI
tara:strand:+ start:1311 stop:1478 length:168 start_codon:yes stop_codon:yes gene_type:complete